MFARSAKDGANSPAAKRYNSRETFVNFQLELTQRARKQLARLPLADRARVAAPQGAE
jgi:hypothetical protein